MLAVFTLVFLLVRVAPGDPAVAALGDYASREAVDALRERMGLNDPIWVQYGKSLYSFIKGDLGSSLITGEPVSRQVSAALPYTLELTIAGILLGTIFGIPIGILTALKRNHIADYLGRAISLVGLSVPAFYMGVLLMIAFSVNLRIFPSVGGGDLGNIQSTLHYLFLPALALGIIMMAYIARMTRSSFLNVLQEDFVRTARAKGLSEKVVIYGHVLRNSIIPIASVIGVYSIVLIGDSVMTEVVFSRPGLGKLMVGAMKQRDYSTLQSVMIIYAAFVVVINLLTDISYAFFDPRVRYK
jgi:ABC-type dipeptide/oligopeptide/nickel transport system permease component